MNWNIERLDKVHQRDSFDCGVAALNEWLRTLASQNERRGLSRTYVAVPQDETRVVGYYALSNHRVSYESLPADLAKGLPRIDLPVVLLARLAVDLSFRGMGLGEDLLLDAFRRTNFVAETVGVCAIEVDAIDESAKQFYLKYGFTSLLDDERHLFLPIKKIRALKLS